MVQQIKNQLFEQKNDLTNKIKYAEQFFLKKRKKTDYSNKKIIKRITYEQKNY